MIPADLKLPPPLLVGNNELGDGSIKSNKQQQQPKRENNDDDDGDEEETTSALSVIKTLMDVKRRPTLSSSRWLLGVAAALSMLLFSCSYTGVAFKALLQNDRCTLANLFYSTPSSFYYDNDNDGGGGGMLGQAEQQEEESTTGSNANSDCRLLTVKGMVATVFGSFMVAVETTLLLVLLVSQLGVLPLARSRWCLFSAAFVPPRLLLASGLVLGCLYPRLYLPLAMVDTALVVWGLWWITDIGVVVERVVERRRVPLIRKIASLRRENEFLRRQVELAKIHNAV